MSQLEYVISHHLKKYLLDMFYPLSWSLLIFFCMVNIIISLDLEDLWRILLHKSLQKKVSKLDIYPAKPTLEVSLIHGITYSLNQAAGHVLDDRPQRVQKKTATGAGKQQKKNMFSWWSLLVEPPVLLLHPFWRLLMAKFRSFRFFVAILLLWIQFLTALLWG